MHMQNMGFFGFVVLVLDIWALVSVVQSASDTAKKVGWIVLILFFPVGGFLIWAFFGPRPRKA
jgi:hypothetical protein